MNAEQIVLASRPKGLPTKENFRTDKGIYQHHLNQPAGIV